MDQMTSAQGAHSKKTMFGVFKDVFRALVGNRQMREFVFVFCAALVMMPSIQSLLISAILIKLLVDPIVSNYLSKKMRLIYGCLLLMSLFAYVFFASSPIPPIPPILVFLFFYKLGDVFTHLYLKGQMFLSKYLGESAFLRPGYFMDLLLIAVGIGMVWSGFVEGAIALYLGGSSLSYKITRHIGALYLKDSKFGNLFGLSMDMALCSLRAVLFFIPGVNFLTLGLTVWNLTGLICVYRMADRASFTLSHQLALSSALAQMQEIRVPQGKKQDDGSLKTSPENVFNSNPRSKKNK